MRIPSPDTQIVHIPLVRGSVGDRFRVRGSVGNRFRVSVRNRFEEKYCPLLRTSG